MDNNQLDQIYSLLRRKLEPSNRDMNILFYTLGAIFASVIFFTDKSDPLSYQYILVMIGMVIIFILLVYNSIKAIPPLEMFLKIPMTKFILTVFLSGYILYSAAEVSIIINSIFNVSSSNFKISASFGTFFYFLNHLVSIFWWYTICIMGGLVISYITEFCVRENDQFGNKINRKISWNQKCWYFIVFSAFFIGLSHYKNIVVQEDSLKYKIFRLALQYDFESHHLCSNINKNYSVLYLGSQQDKVLINFNYQADFTNFEEFMTSKNYDNFSYNLKNNLFIFDVDQCIYSKYEKKLPLQ